jgi:hypothetical protein
MFFSKTTGGFYDQNIHTVIPQDAVEITDELYATLMTGTSSGRPIVGDENGNPVLSDPPENGSFVPIAVTPRQARLALLGAGLLSTVESAIAAMPGVEGEAARITWEFAQEISRDFPLILQLASILEISDEQIDQLFITAATL